MRRIVEQHLARLRRAQRSPAEVDDLRAQLIARMYPNRSAELRPARQVPVPTDAPDWFFEEELRRSGLWDMMERCYPSAQSQSQ